MIDKRRASGDGGKRNEEWKPPNPKAPNFHSSYPLGSVASQRRFLSSLEKESNWIEEGITLVQGRVFRLVRRTTDEGSSPVQQ